MHDLEHRESMSPGSRFTLPESVNNDDVIHHDDDPWETTDNEYDGNHYENNRQALLTCTVVVRSSQFLIPSQDNRNKQ